MSISLYEEAYNYILSLYMASNRKSVHESKLFLYLSTRVPSIEIHSIMTDLERRHIIRRTPGADTYEPCPRHTCHFPPPPSPYDSNPDPVALATELLYQGHTHIHASIVRQLLAKIDHLKMRWH